MPVLEGTMSAQGTWWDDRRQELSDLIQKHRGKGWMPRELQWQDRAPLSYTTVRRTTAQPSRARLALKCRASVAKYTTCEKVQIQFTHEQERIADNWMEMCRRMYNYTRRLINRLAIQQGGYELSEDGYPIFTRGSTLPKVIFEKIRDMLKLKTVRLVIKSRRQLGDARVRVHTLNLAVRQACANYKACVSNLVRRHFHRFTLPPLQDKPTRTMTIQKDKFHTGGFFEKVYGNIAATREVDGDHRPYQWDPEARSSILQHDLKTDQWTLYVPLEDRRPEPVPGRHRAIALDPGYRTLLSGYAHDHALAIGDDIMVAVRDWERQVRRILHSRRHGFGVNSRGRRALRLADEKLEHRVDDMHWKVAGYLTDNYDAIILGDMSPVGIISRRGNLRAGYKRRLVKIRYGKFRERLAFKCQQKSVGFRVVDESFTSRACAACGWMRAKSDSKTYECHSCGHVTDRDVNAARNIYLKHLLPK